MKQQKNVSNSQNKVTNTALSQSDPNAEIKHKNFKGVIITILPKILRKSLHRLENEVRMTKEKVHEFENRLIEIN